jgi:high affinity sulfate transporter 1
MARWRTDVVAGLTTAAVVIPKAMAYAAIAGLPLAAGLYTVLVASAVYAATGTSRVLSVTTTSALAVLTGTAIAPLVAAGAADAPQAAAALCMMAGVMLLVAGAFRLGFLADFMSVPVLIGFKGAIGIVIIVDQLPKLLGLHLPKTHVIQQALTTIAHLPETSLVALGLGLLVLAVIHAFERFAPAMPATLAGIAVAIGVSASGLLDGRAVDLVGSIQPGLPLPAMPDLAAAATLWPAAMGIAFMCFVESIAAGRAFVRPGDPLPRANRELIALGLSNVAGSVFTAMPAGGGTSQTAENVGAGARSQRSGLAAASAAAATLLFLHPAIALLPHTALAAVVIASTASLFKPSEFRAIRAIRLREFRWAAAAFAGVIVFGTLNGIVIAVAISVVTLIYQANHPPVYELKSVPGLLVLRTEGRIFFANARRVGDEMWMRVRAAKPSVLALDMSAVLDLEYTALISLIEAERKLRDAGTMLWLVALNPGVSEIVRRSPLQATLGADRIFPDLASAMAAFSTSAGTADRGLVTVGGNAR